MRYRPIVRPGLRWIRQVVGLLVVGLGAGLLSSSCTLTLDPEIACGDGYVDEDAGEQCDPAVPSSYVDACRGGPRPEGIGACDPVTCTLISDLLQCAVCGDDEVDPEAGEQCDGSNLDNARCPGGVGLPLCTSDCQLDYDLCRTCGNGMPDPDEECDSPQGGLVGSPRPCTELPGLTGQAYTSGEYNFCDADCQYSRAGCGYCGNGELENAKAVDFKGNASPAEICDRGDFDVTSVLNKYGGGPCDAPGLRPLVVCNDDCSDFELTEPAMCCLLPGEPCPNNESPLRCCFEFDNPDQADACLPSINTEGGWEQVCR